MSRLISFRPRSSPVRNIATFAWLSVLVVTLPAHAAEPKTVGGLKNPGAVAVGPEGKVFVTTMGERNKPGDGSVVTVDPSGKILTFAGGLDDPRGMVFVGDRMFVTDSKKVWVIDAKGKGEVYVAPEAFPRSPSFLFDIASDGRGNLYVSDSGDGGDKKGAVFRINSRKKVVMVLDGELTSPQITAPTGILVDDLDHFFVADFGEGYLYRFDMFSNNAQRLGGGFGGTGGLAEDRSGRLFVSDAINGRIFQVTSEFVPPTLVSDRFRSAAGIAATPDGRTLLVTDMKAGTLTWLPIP